MSDPTTTNQAASIVNQILKDLIEGAGTAAIEADAIAAESWLALPFVKQIFEWVLNYIADKIYVQAAYAATQIVIDLQVNLEESKTNDAFQNLQLAVASGDQAAISKASSDLNAAYSDLIHYNGSSSP